MKVRCNWCEWEGQEEDLILNEDCDEFCPKCHDGRFLMDVTTEEEDEDELRCIMNGFSLNGIKDVKLEEEKMLDKQTVANLIFMYSQFFSKDEHSKWVFWSTLECLGLEEEVRDIFDEEKVGESPAEPLFYKKDEEEK